MNTKPFMVPNFVTLDLAGCVHEEPTVPLKAVDAETLSKMCDEFRAAIFKKAGKKDPK
ncbi:MAG: hypothetical protein WC869_00725 [Phycisphaerae bacterium]